MDLQRPKYEELCPKWNLALVLAYITSPPFKPIMNASLWHLTLKTVFLLKLVSGHRRNELYALSCYRFRADGGLVTLITELGFLAKNQEPQDSTPRIVIPAGSCVLSGRLRFTWKGPKNRRSVAAEPGYSLILRSLRATFHRHTSLYGSRNWSRMPMSMRELTTSTWPRCQPIMSESFRRLGQRLTVLHSMRLCKQRTGRARLPLQASISKQWRLRPRDSLRWAPLWQPRQSSSPQAHLRMRKRAYTLLYSSSHREIESADSSQFFMKRDWCFSVGSSCSRSVLA